MRKPIVIPTIALTLMLLAGGFYLHHRSKVPVAVAQPSKIAVKASIRSAPTEIVTFTRSVRPQTELVFANLHQPDVRIGTIRTIMDPKADTLTRQKAVRALPRNLTLEQRRPLIDFLTTRHAEDRSQAGQVLKNDLMDAFVGQNDPLQELAQLFIGIYQDKAQDPVIRDYALQHLTLLSERLDRPVTWDASQVQVEQKLIRDTLFQCAEARDSSISGTALLGLAQISQAHPEVDRVRLGQDAIAMTDTGVDEAARVTAFQICARLNVSSALPLAVKAAQSDSSSIVRMSAIGALGLFGSADDIPLLNQIAQHNAPYKSVAVLAMQRIQERTQ